jgi:hypothetical protein
MRLQLVLLNQMPWFTTLWMCSVDLKSIDKELTSKSHPRLFCTLDKMDEQWIISGADSIKDVDIDAKFPVVVQGVSTLKVVGCLPFQDCFASSIFTSSTMGKFLVIARDRFIYSTHIESNPWDLKDLPGVFITDVKKKLLYTHPVPIASFLVSDGTFVINDKRCIYLAQPKEQFSAYKSKEKLTNLKGFDPKSSEPIQLVVFSTLKILWCCNQNGSIFL